MTIKLSEEDRKELVKLYGEAEHTPIIVVGGVGENLASLAWDRVRDKFDELGKKYDFNPEGIKGIDKKTGELMC